MEPFTRVEGVAAPMPIDNVDTDAIIPSKETTSVARTGYGEKLFANWRYLPGARTPDPAFVLNRPPFTHAKILVAGRNFGCGSSREAAVWSLQQFGIRCVIAESYGQIFRNNCIRNGLLPVTLPIDAVQSLLDQLQGTSEPLMAVDLDAQVLTSPTGETLRFQIGPLERDMLLAGADEIGLTLARRDQIEAFRERDRARRPWVYSGNSN